VPDIALRPRPLPAIPDGSMPLAAKAAFDRARAFEANGDLEAAAANIVRSMELGGGRVSTIQASKIAIEAGRYEDARRLLEPLIDEDAARTDVPARYNLALVDHIEGRYNAARMGYLVTLHAQPDFAVARYNLAVLAWSHGVNAEAHHHAEEYARLRPGSPEAIALRAKVATPAPNNP